MSVPALKPDYYSDDDQLFLEDQTSRIRLMGNKVNVKEGVTGVVCIVLGAENQKSTFEVEDWCLRDCLSQSSGSRKFKSGKLVFLSGLELASTPPNLALGLLIEWLGGLAGLAEAQQDEASIVQVVIAGNSIKGRADQHLSKGLVSGKVEEPRLDSFLEIIGSNCCVQTFTNCCVETLDATPISFGAE